MSSARLFEAISTRIATSALPDGTRLTEEGLAREFGVSRTPVREALRLLEQATLVERVQPRGYQVNVPDLRTLDEIYSVRCALEELAVQLAVDAVGTPEFAKLRESLSSGNASSADIVGGFHAQFAALSGNSELMRVLDAFYRRTRPYARLDGATTERAAVIRDDHLALLSLVEEGKVPEATELMRNHIARTRETIQALMRGGVTSMSFTPAEAPPDRDA